MQNNQLMADYLRALVHPGAHAAANNGLRFKNTAQLLAQPL